MSLQIAPALHQRYICSECDFNWIAPNYFESVGFPKVKHIINIKFNNNRVAYMTDKEKCYIITALTQYYIDNQSFQKLIQAVRDNKTEITIPDVVVWEKTHINDGDIAYHFNFTCYLPYGVMNCHAYFDFHSNIPRIYSMTSAMNIK